MSQGHGQQPVHSFQPGQSGQPVQRPGHTAQPVIGAFRDGNILVCQQYAQLPPFCAITNEPTDQFEDQTFRWHSPALYLMLPLLVLLPRLSHLMTQTAAVKMPVGKAWTDKRDTRNMYGCFGSIIFAVVCIAIPLMFASYFSQLAMYLSVFGGPVLAIFFFRFLSGMGGLKATRIAEGWIWLKGAHPGFLERLPPVAK